jgi:DNA-binding HxlR family transcriptional regulator
LCPINLALELLGDRWTLLLIRDLMFAGKRGFRELLQSEEGIASNILAERLVRLVDAGILVKAGDPTHKQKASYRLTPMGVDLLPVLAQLGIWGRKYLPVTEATAAVAAALERGGPALWSEMCTQLRAAHGLGAKPPPRRSKPSVSPRSQDPTPG